MKALVLLLSFAALCCAQNRRPAPDQQPQGNKRLSSVTWDLKSHKLIWEVQTGKTVEGEFRADSTSRYEITPDEAVMRVEDERRGFTEQEAASLHKLLDTLSLYCAESVVWWDQGQGRKLKEGEPGKSPSHEAPTRQRVDDRNPPKKEPAAPRPALVAVRSER